MKEIGYGRIDAAIHDHRKNYSELDRPVELANNEEYADINAATANLIVSFVEHIKHFDSDYAESINSSMDVPELGLMMFSDIRSLP